MVMRRWFAAGLLLLTTACSDRTFTFEVPENYTGWVTVRFRATGCSEKKTPTRTTIAVRRDGTGCTSVRGYPTTSFSEFYYVRDGKRTKELPRTGWGEGGMIWAESTEIDGHEYRFFVGTEKQLNESYKARATAAQGRP